MSQSKAFKAGIGYTIGNVFIKGISFITLPIFTRLMTTSDYGYYSSFLTYESIFFVILGFAFHSSLKNAKLEYGEQNIDSYVSSVSIYPIAFTIIVSLLTVPFKNEIGNALGIKSEYVVLMLVYSWSSAVISMYNNRIALDYSYKKYLMVSLISSVSNVLLSLIFMLIVFKEDALKGRTYGTFISYFMIAIALTAVFFKKSRPVIDKRYIKFAFSYSLPIIPHGISQVILAQFSKIIILKKTGSHAAGIYGFAMTILLIPQIILSSLDTVYGPWFYEKYAENDYKAIKKRTNQYVKLFALIICCMFCVSPEIVKILGDKSFWEVNKFLCPAILGVYYLFMYYVTVTIEYYYKKTDFIAFGTVFASSINIILCLVLIPKYGYMVAAYVTSGTYLLYYLFHLFVANKITNKNLPFDMRTMYLSAVFVTAFCVIVKLTMNAWYIRYLLVIFICAVFIRINHDDIKTMINRKRNS